jgi:sugar lactone lactonase YvrE
MTISCPLTSITPQYPYYEQWSCSGGSLSIHSSDGTLSITGAFISGLFNLQTKTSSGSTTYYYGFFANFAGSQTKNGSSAAVVGSVSEVLAPLNSSLNPAAGTIQTGLIDLSQRFEPVYIADTGNNRIVEAADILGLNWASLGTAGSGVNQFSGPWGIALDSAGKIYVADTGNCRIVRVDNMQGINWTSFGTCGSGTGQFSGPRGLWVDSTGKIYVADSGNNRIVQMNDMTGSGFVALGTLGKAVGQFNTPSAVTTDSLSHIYIADSGNSRLVETADISGKNWAVLQFAAGYLTPSGIALDSTNRIYTTDSYQNQFIRVDNIAGANPVYLYINYNNYSDDPLKPTGVFLDRDGAAYVADTGNNRIERYFDMSFNDVLLLGTAGKGVRNLSQPHGAVAVTVAKSVGVSSAQPRPLTFPTELLRVASPSETEVLTNIGTAPFTVSSVTSSSTDFPVTNNCPLSLAGGSSCSASAVFKPTAGGLRKGALTFTLAGAVSQAVSMSGSGALVTVSPSELIMYECANGNVAVSNPLSTSTSIKSVSVSGQFTQTNNCSTLSPGASCTVTVSWCSLTPITGTLTITDSSGTAQYVPLTGE